MTPCLNWKEIELWVGLIQQKIEKSRFPVFVDRVIVPARQRFLTGYVKGEWVIRLAGPKEQGFLTLSLRPRHPYLTYGEGKGPQAAQEATRSAFDLELNKTLKDQRFLGVEAIKRDRGLVLWFGSDQNTLALLLLLIPAAPEAILFEAPRGVLRGKLLLASRPASKLAKSVVGGVFEFAPSPLSKAPESPPVRSVWLEALDGLSREVERELQVEAAEQRLAEAEKALKARLKLAKERLEQTEETLTRAKHEPEWQELGDQLKGLLAFYSESWEWIGEEDESSENSVENKVSRTGKSPKELYGKLEGKWDRNLTPIQQMTRFYSNAKRKKKRIEEATLRLNRLRELEQEVQALLLKKPSAAIDVEARKVDWKALEIWERSCGMGIGPGSSGETESGGAQSKRNIPGVPSKWLGKSFVSIDGMPICVGRSKDENLELTFKIARGNDIWMHVKGRPGAHVVIPTQSGKSVPLGTLLDAAQLTVVYSQGANWGKTEVDYTFKKYVKRIRDSSEASYTQNKTLIVEPDAARRERLIGASGKG